MSGITLGRALGWSPRHLGRQGLPTQQKMLAEGAGAQGGLARRDESGSSTNHHPQQCLPYH